ncbi:MAG: hypothetical protein EHM85_11890 [Desulfobacteraceae bacterium]|nr:MAG: hypothetical protein EHM85_11890 [Desulfobacteraceae bacterium]
MPGINKKKREKTMRKKLIKSDRCALYAPDRNRNIYDDYVEDILLHAEKKTFEKHLEICPICSGEIVAAMRREEIAKRSYLLSEIGQKKSLNRKLNYLDSINNHDVVHEEYIALAASPPRRLDEHGVAYGVAVDRETGHGALLECIAVISDAVRGRSKLEIRAMELLGLKRSGVEERITTPTDYLEDILGDMFVSSPFLAPFRLWEKAIRVEVNYKAGSGYIYESDSVALAVLVAIISAVTGKPVDNDIFFSAGIKLNGYLEGVGDLEHKIKIAKDQHMKACFTADETRPICADKIIKKSLIALYYFEKIEEVLMRLGLIERKSGKGSTKKTNNK